MKPLGIPTSNIVEPKDVWKYVSDSIPSTFEIKGRTYRKEDIPKLIYPEELHTMLGL